MGEAGGRGEGGEIYRRELNANKWLGSTRKSLTSKCSRDDTS